MPSPPCPATAATPSPLVTVAPAPAVGAEPEASSGYDRPPQNILDVLHAPSPPVPYVNPTHDTVLLVSWEDYPPLSRVALPFLRLEMLRWFDKYVKNAPPRADAKGVQSG
jgi:hypothetical protein